MPVTNAEADYIHTHGWPALEAALTAENPDLTDLTRASITVAVAQQPPP